MNKYNLIETFFTNPDDAIKFFVRLKELRFASDDASCVAILTKVSEDKWTYEIHHESGKFVGEYLKPFKPSKINIDKFNHGCKGLAQQLELYLDTDDVKCVEDPPSPFGDMAYEE